MKVLLHLPSQSILPYPRADDADVIGLDPSLLALEVHEESPPDFDPATHRLIQSESIDQEARTLTRGWTAQPLADPGPKSWPNVQAFMAEFSMQELAEIGLSTHPTIAALRVMLSTWLSTVLSDDPRVILGLDALESEQILDAARRAVICGLTENDE